MVTLTKGTRPTAHYIVSEANGYRSRDQIVIASGSGKLDAGTVLGKITAAGATIGQYKPYAPGANDGTQNAVAILYEGCDATAKTVRRTVTARDAEVHADVLVWANGVTDPQKTTALAALAALGVAAR
ncbi:MULTISPECIES: head decoration protein [unclassified Rhizobium]|uniref:head decoration protein n=1 Tax=unclassified Rhizobium TaxID=2613769 RepID=UPI001AD9C65A|nr:MULTISPECIES: head decoration protein [unclassified Rhizobium]MBO9125466.1 head decoration protein [Rhizobium sp. 16-488-2b]MBO9176051.1 head decoration protein [Rhizobium sp. 16-488-2a]